MPAAAAARGVLHDSMRPFETLCLRYAADVAPSTMLKELKHADAVIEDSGGKLIAQMRVYMPVHMDPVHMDPEQMLTSGSVLEDLSETVAYNLHRSDDDLPRFERRATNTHMPRTSIPAFKQFLDGKSQAFLERVDTWLRQHEDKQASHRVRLGLGTYWIGNTINEGSHA